MPMITGRLRFPDYHPLLPRSLLSRRELVSAIYTPMGTLPWRLSPNLGSGNLFLSRTHAAPLAPVCPSPSLRGLPPCLVGPPASSSPSGAP